MNAVSVFRRSEVVFIVDLCGIFSAPVNKIQNYDIAALVKRYASNPKDKNTLAHKERRENKSSAKETIGTLIQNARKSNSENSEPDFQQLSLF